MNNLSNISFHFNTNGITQKIELDLPILFPKLQEMFGVDLQPVIIPLLIKVTRLLIRDLQTKQEINWFNQEDELALNNLQEQEQNLVSCLENLSINHE